VAALKYGSFALAHGDRFSDIEFYLFFEVEALEGLEEEGGSVRSRHSNFTTSTSAATVMLSSRTWSGGIPLRTLLERGAGRREGGRLVPALESAVLVDKVGELSRRVSRLALRSPN